jgi:hypothetical protein
MCRLYISGGPARHTCMADSSLLNIQPYTRIILYGARAGIAAAHSYSAGPLLCGNCACALNCARVAFFRASATMPALTWG